MGRMAEYQKIQIKMKGFVSMKIKEGFVLRDVAGQAVVIAVGDASRTFHGMINLNATGRMIWQGVSEGLPESEIAERLTEEFDVDLQTAQKDIRDMISRMQSAGVLE